MKMQPSKFLALQILGASLILGTSAWYEDNYDIPNEDPDFEEEENEGNLVFMEFFCWQTFT